MFSNETNNGYCKYIVFFFLNIFSVSEKTTELKKLTTEIENRKSEINKIQEQLTSQKNEVNCVQEQLKSVKNENSTLKNQVDNQTKELSSLKADNDKKSSDSALVSKLKEEVEAQKKKNNVSYVILVNMMLQ